MPQKQMTVLVVDDEEDIRLIVETILMEIADFYIVTAADGETAVLSAKAHKPDLILLDVNMPVKDGFSTFFELSQDAQTRDIPVIMLTGVSQVTGMKVGSEDMLSLLGKEPAAFLDKPVDPGVLTDTVKKVLDLE